MEWRWDNGVLHRYDDGLPAATCAASTQRELQRTRPVLVDGTKCVPSFECTPAFTRLVRPWRGDQAWKPKRRHIKRALGKDLRKTGTAAGATRAGRWHASDPDIANSLESVPWHRFVQVPGLTTYESQLWTRLRHHQLHAWGAKDSGGCTKAHCNTGEHASTGHIAWACSHAQRLWRRLATFWGAPECSQSDLRHAVFARQPLPTSYDWRGLFPERESMVTDRVEHWLKFAWTLLITCGLHRLWTQSVAAARGEDDRQDQADYFTVVYHWTNKLRGALMAVHSEDSETRGLDVRVLRAIYTGLVTHDEPVPRITFGLPRYLLFFDGGSRGNPGPGGSGSVIVRLGDQPELIWAASMSYAQEETTNNFAEYKGLCTGLAAAEHHGWAPLDIIGDSMLIIRQMRSRRRPKAPTLRPLYEAARATADALRVRNWHHHYRSKNKMADKAANQAMDSGTSFQASADTGRPEFGGLREWLSNDVNEWLTKRDAPLPPE